MSTRDKLKHHVALFTLIFSSVVFLLFLFWWIYPYRTFEVEQPYNVLTHKVKQGGLLTYEINYCKYTDVDPVVQRQFVDGIIYATPEATAIIKRGCGKLVNTIEIPHNLPIGDYYIKSRVSYKVNPIRVITHEFITERFTVN